MNLNLKRPRACRNNLNFTQKTILIYFFAFKLGYCTVDTSFSYLTNFQAYQRESGTNKKVGSRFSSTGPYRGNFALRATHETGTVLFIRPKMGKNKTFFTSGKSNGLLTIAIANLFSVSPPQKDRWSCWMENVKLIKTLQFW